MHAQLDLRTEVAYFSTRDSFKEVVLSTWETVICAHMFTIHQLPSLIGLQAIPKLGGGGGTCKICMINRYPSLVHGT